MRYLVPQFLETEQTIWGPFTFKNFVILIGVGGVAFMLYFYIGLVAWIATVIVFAAITLALMFYRHGGRPLTSVLFDFFKHLFGARRYTWVGVEQKKGVSEFISLPKSDLPKPKEEEAKSQIKPPLEKIEELGKMLDQG